MVHVRAKTHALFAAVALVAGLAAAAPPAVAEEADGGAGFAEDCTPDHVWFLGIVYDAEQRQDFRADVRNFEMFLSTLRQTYCIPESQATILAMENNYTDQGKTYAEGSEANLKAELRRMGAEASQHEDSKFFFFLSSHGLMWTGALSSCAPTRAAMSFADLKDGGGEDGFLDDCELGDELNDNFSPETRMFVAVDCSFCGGFSDSLTAVSGTVPDGSVPTSSGIPAPNRVVITGCAITTECFGSTGNNGGVTYHHMRRVLQGNVECDGWTAPGFPAVQGFDAPVNGEPFNAPDGRCTASEWFFGAVQSAYTSLDVIGIQQQFRIKYGMDSLADDIVIVGEDAGDPDPDPSPSPSPSPGDEATFYFRSDTGVGNADVLIGANTFSSGDAPTIDDPAVWQDIPGAGQAQPNQAWDPNWRGEVDQAFDNFTIDFWQKAPVGEAFGEATYDVTIWVGDGLDSTRYDLPTIQDETVLRPNPTRVTHTFTTMFECPAPTSSCRSDDGTGEVPLDIDPAGQPVTVSIAPFFLDDPATVVYDGADFPSGFAIGSAGPGDPDPTPSPSPTPTESPSPSPTPTESPSPSPTPTESPSPSPEPEFGMSITSPAEGEVVDADFVAQGTTEGAAGGEALRLLPRSNVDRSRDVAGAGAAVDELRAERLPVLEFDEVVELDQPPPRAVPEDSIGIGPGSTILINRGGSTGLCTAAFIFRDKTTGKVYLGTAGHCFMPDSAESTDGQGANFNRNLVTRVRVCVANCIGGGTGLVTGSFGIYPGTTRDLGTPGGPVLTYARQRIGPQELGNDFGIVEIPPNLWDEIRTDMPVWGGPDTSDTSRRVQLGDPTAHYGNGAVVGETFPTKGRAGVGGIGTTASFWTMYGAAAPGDSGSAVNIGAVGGASGIEGRWPAGILTHAICCGGTVGGTNASRAIEMAGADAGFDLELIHDPSQLGPPPDPDPTEPGDSLEAAVTFPEDGATLDASETPVVEVLGTGSFPLKGGPGTLRYWTHRSDCGSANDVLWMDLNQGAAPDEGDGCGSLAGPIGPVWEPVVGEINSTHPADPSPQEPILLDPDRPIRATMVLGGFQGQQDNPQPVPILLDASVRLTHDGVTVGSQRITNEIILAPQTEVVFEFPAETAAIPADAPLTFTFVVHHAAGPVFVHHGGDTGSHVDIPLAAEPDNRVEVSVDDPSFSEGSLLTVSGTKSWSAPWDIGDLEGEHTLYARAVQDGTVQDPPASVTVNIVSAEPPSEFAVEVRLTGDSGTIVDWALADDYDGTDWSHPFTDVPPGDVTLDARLLRDSEVVATDSVSFTVASPDPAATQIFFTDDSATEGRYTENVLIEARLIDSDGNPVAGREVAFRLTGVDDERSWTATTDADGIAGETVTLDARPGGYLLRAAFAGDDDFEGSETSTFFVIERMDTDTELVVQGTGANRTLTATLTTELGEPIQGATIEFFGDGTSIGSAVTNAQGRAVLQAPPGYRGNRRHHFEAVFEGDDFYEGSSGTAET